MSAPIASRGLHGRHVLIALLAFFGVIFAVNGLFLYAALSTHTGVVAQEPYRKGLAYNARIAAEAQQTRLGWLARIELTRDPLLITVKITAADAMPVSGLRLSGVLGRPTTSRHDRPLVFTEVLPGTYRVRLESLEPGAWLAGIEAAWPHSTVSEPVYRLRKRLWLTS